ncbi:MAG: MerR family transcriptional regulator [Actinomycetota bacterium]|nr:MerR family transcriptional regulator [Actinomycetota bacterium]
MNELTIGEVAARAGINTSRIRYYERVGVLPHAERGTGGQRRYAPAVLDRLALIDVAQRAGLTLEEIRELTGSENHGERIRALAERKLPAVEALIARAEAMRAWLQAAQSCDCATVDVCSLFTNPAHAPPVAVAIDSGSVAGLAS